MSWFEVDRDGLRQLLEDRDKSFILRELVQNAWDEPGVARCDVTLEAIPGERAARLVVEDDAPEGAAFNAYFASKVCDAAYLLYRERFLAANWGEDWIEATVAPAEDLELEYEEADEEMPPTALHPVRPIDVWPSGGRVWSWQ